MQEGSDSRVQLVKSSRNNTINKNILENLQGYGLILVPVIIIGLFGIYPSINVFIMSFQKFNMLAGSNNASFTGMANYLGLIGDAEFWNTLKNTFVFTLIVVPVQSLVALIFAVLINQKLKGIELFRTIFFIPVIMSFVVVSVTWKMLYDQDFGLANSIFSFLNLPEQQFLVNPDQAMICVIFMCIWKSWGWYMVIFLSGLQDIPRELYESSFIDGASPFRRFISITLPLLKRTTLFVLIMTTIDAFKIFTPVYIMTNGGPLGKTDTIVHYIWKTAFRMNEMGYAAAMSICLFLIVFIITILQMRIAKTEN